jgi:TetR/AcrR family transcriptional regulator, cholesterol catabolism regulator
MEGPTPAQPSSESTVVEEDGASRDASIGTRVNGSSSTRERLLTTAASLFHERGYAGTTTREIAREVGIEKASLYHYIDGKEDLLYDLCSNSLWHIREGAEGVLARETDPQRQLQLVIEAHIKSSLANRDIHATMLLELRCLSPERRRRVIQMRDDYEEILRGVTARCQASGALRADIEPKLLTLALLNLLNWTIFWFKPGGEYTPERVADVLYQLYLQGAGSRPVAAGG